MSNADALHQQAEPAVVCGPLSVAFANPRALLLHGKPVAVSPTQLCILTVLMRAAGRVVSRDELYENAFAVKMPHGSRTIDTEIFRIRQALGELGHHVLTVRGRGYRLDTEALSDAPRTETRP